jgi:Tesmin/TSO1-like CXC domain, cysteine-rich domain
MERGSAFSILVTDSTPIRCNIAETLLGLRKSSETLGDREYPYNACGEDANEEEGEAAVELVELCSESQSSSRRQDSSDDLCKCKKSRCLKLYCVCFASKRFCTSACKCVDCANSVDSKDMKEAAEQAILERNPEAFASKFKPSVDAPVSFHKTGCKYCSHAYILVLLTSNVFHLLGVVRASA